MASKFQDDGPNMAKDEAGLKGAETGRADAENPAKMSKDVKTGRTKSDEFDDMFNDMPV